MRCQILEAFIDRNLRSNFIKINFERNQQICEQRESDRK